MTPFSTGLWRGIWISSCLTVKTAQKLTRCCPTANSVSRRFISAERIYSSGPSEISPARLLQCGAGLNGMASPYCLADCFQHQNCAVLTER